MVAAWFAFALAFRDGSPLVAVVGDAGILLVPAVAMLTVGSAPTALVWRLFERPRHPGR